MGPTLAMPVYPFPIEDGNSNTVSPCAADHGADCPAGRAIYPATAKLSGCFYPGGTAWHFRAELKAEGARKED
ncbi:hypothetical protein AA0616_2079 [Komagataeibacter nataicola NRIC 0616]|nr:hypothetical protein AA0616_2079 [Komagataeibacter nataicola NRIC 0616]